MFEGGNADLLLSKPQDDMFYSGNNNILETASELDSTNGNPPNANGKSILGSLGLDPKSRNTPMSLIQQDFPSTPSAFFGSRFDQEVVPAEDASFPAGLNSPTRNKHFLPPNQASSGVDDLTNVFQQTSLIGGAQPNPAIRMPPNGRPYPPNAQAPPVQYIMPGQPGQQYYMQQPVYVDQNGQPIYYRDQYQQGGMPAAQFMYAPGDANGEYIQFNPALAQQPGYYAQGQQAMYVDGMGRRMMYNYGPNMRGMPGNGMDGRQMERHYRNDQNGFRERDNRRDDRYKNNNVNNINAVNPMRDPLVDDFRATYGKSKQWQLADLVGHVVAFCQDQHGSRFIQQRLEVCNDSDKQIIFDEIVVAAPSLLTDVFGNYVLQKLFEYGTLEQCEGLARMLENQCVQLSMQMYGCRVVQKALEYVGTDRLIAIVSEFENPPVLLRCVHDANGNHVIQKCIEVVSKASAEATDPEMAEFLNLRINFILDAFKGRIKELSSHPYGCRVIQRLLEHCSSDHKTTVLEELRQYYSELVQDCYGNYVIQFVMQHGWEVDRASLIKEVQTNLLDFSQHKFASNVVEKCLQFANKRDRDEMIWTIINVTFDLNNPVDAKTGHCVLESMVRDPYANYVVQKVIDVSDERQRGAICRYVKENIVQLRRYTYGKHIIVRLEKITGEKF